MATAEARERYGRKNETADLKRAFEYLDRKKDGVIDEDDLYQVFMSLGHKTKKGEIADMIWEVDEDCDSAITWKEFQTMYHRCRNDIAGTEPRRLFNVVEFVMNDKNELGFVTMENAMQLMYLRHGREDLDAQLEDVFGTADLNSGKTLCLTEFLTSLHANQVKQLRNRVTAKTYQVPPAGKKS